MCPPIDQFPERSGYSLLKNPAFSFTGNVTKETVERLFLAIKINRNRASDKDIANFFSKHYGIALAQPDITSRVEMIDLSLANYARPLPENIVLAFFKKLKEIAKNDNYNRLTSDEIEVITKRMEELNYKQTTINVFRTMFLPESNPL